MSNHIIVTGGSGFLGKQICRSASDQSIPVVSISRGGKPANIDEGQYYTVYWEAADVRNIENWNRHLENCRAVIHSIGIIEEHPELGITYESAIFDTAKAVADAAKHSGVEKFVFISAAGAGPDTPAGYMLNKHKAENYLKTRFENLVILRPGMMFGADSPGTTEESAELFRMMENDEQLRASLWPKRPLPVEIVAHVAIYAAMNNIKGDFSVDETERLGGEI